jgi:hypothetical protein
MCKFLGHSVVTVLASVHLPMKYMTFSPRYFTKWAYNCLFIYINIPCHAFLFCKVGLELLISEDYRRTLLTACATVETATD